MTQSFASADGAVHSHFHHDSLFKDTQFAHTRVERDGEVVVLEIQGDQLVLGFPNERDLTLEEIGVEIDLLDAAISELTEVSWHGSRKRVVIQIQMATVGKEGEEATLVS